MVVAISQHYAPSHATSMVTHNHEGRVVASVSLHSVCASA